MTCSTTRPAVLISLFLAYVLPSHLTHAQREGFEFPKWAVGGMYGVSTEGPMLKYLIQQPAFNTSVHILNSYFSDVEENILSSLRNGSSPPPNQRFKACTVSNPKFFRSIEQVFGIRGLPKPIYDCTSDVVGTRLYSDRAPLFSVDVIFDSLRSIENLQESGKDFIFMNVLKNWQHAQHVLADWTKRSGAPFFPWQRENKRCELSGAGFYRVGTYWYINVGVTNAPPTYALAKWKRQFIQEFVYVGRNGRDAHNMRMRAPTYVSDTEYGTPMENATTTFVRKGGRNLPCEFYSVPPEDNPALADAMVEADGPVRQATDALTHSSLALLFLPLVLNLVPLALIMHVGSRMMLMYMLCSDILTVVPLTIKGLELIVIGSQRFRSVVLRVENNSRGIRGIAAAGQIWTAECQARLNVRAVGISFVVVSVSAVLVGVWLEIWARQFMVRRNQRRADMFETYWRVGNHKIYKTYNTAKEAEVESLGTCSGNSLDKMLSAL